VLKLIFSDLLAGARVWLGTLLIAAATGAVAAVAAAEVQTAARIGGNAGLALYAISGTVLVFTATTAIVVLGATTTLAVALRQRGYALWLLIGVRPAQVTGVVVAQVVLVALAGAVAGCAVVVPVLPAFFRFSFTGSSGLDGVEPSFGLVAAASSVLFVTVVVVLGGVRGALRAGAAPVLHALREPDLPRRRMTASRALTAVLLAAAVTGLVTSLPTTAPDKLSVPLMLIAPVTAGLFAAVGPLLFHRFVLLWTAVVPATSSAAWFLARESTSHNAGRSAAAISPLMVAVALAGGFYTANGTAGAVIAARTGETPPGVSAGAAVLLIGGPLLLAVLGSAGTIFMSGRGREREIALVQAAGGTRGTVLAVAAGEAVIYVGTAVLLGSAAVLVTSVAGGWASGEWVFAAPAVGLVAALGLVLTLLATTAPAVHALREAVPRVLAAD